MLLDPFVSSRGRCFSAWPVNCFIAQHNNTVDTEDIKVSFIFVKKINKQNKNKAFIVKCIKEFLFPVHRLTAFSLNHWFCLGALETDVLLSEPRLHGLWLDLVETGLN